MGPLFALIGNYMPNLKPNYVAGYRISWTLNNADNWRKTHDFAGKSWFFGGLIMVVLCMLLPFETALVVFTIVVLALLIIPAVYSYKLHKKGNVILL
ncbi:hypothetical protein BH20BAC1_BH20BAC1_26170 [soil metagenome]